nr:disease resistance-like protein csa1 [Quercus suber]
MLNFCTSLRSLPKLPLKIEVIGARYCTSLETLPIRPEDEFVPGLDLTNCVKLIANQENSDVLSGMLRRYIINYQIHVKREERYYGFVIPGSEVPKWLSHKNVGMSVNLQVPSSDLLCNKLMGIVLCVVFVFRQHHPFDQLQSCSVGFFGTFTHELRCSIIADGCEIDTRSLLLSEEFGKIESYHLLLYYLPSRDFISFGNWKEKLIPVDANGLSHIEVKFETEGPGLEVTKCGANLVFGQDIEDVKQTKAWSSSCSIAPYEDDLDTKIKQSRDEARPSGEAPHP